MTRTRFLFAAALLALTAPAAIAGCGGDDESDRDPQEVIDATFNNDEEVTSGVLDLSIDVSAGDQGSFNASLEGPIQGSGDEATLPQLDLTANASGEGGGQSIDFEGGLVATEDNAFVEYQGQAYEVGSETFAQLKESFEASAAQAEEAEGEDASASLREGCERAVEAQGGDPAACDFEISGWFENLTNEGSEDLEGTSVVHISGDVNAAQMFEDLIGVAQALPDAQGQVDQAQVEQATEAISGASFDVYSGEEDDILRQLDFDLAIDPSAVEGGAAVPVESVDLGFSIGISELNEEQTIEAPEDAQPIQDLLGELGLGGLGPLGGLEGLGGGGLGGAPEPGGGAGGGGASDAYFECVEAAGSDQDAIAACADEL